MFFKMNQRFPNIVKASWHPYSPAGLCILYKEQEFDLFNYIDFPEAPQISLNLAYSSLNSGVKGKHQRKMNFVDYCFPQQIDQIEDYFTMYMISEDGTILVVYPFFMEKTVLNARDHQWVQTHCKSKQLMSQLPAPYKILVSLLSKCNFEKETPVDN